MASSRRAEADGLVRSHGEIITSRQVGEAGYGRSWLRSAVAAGDLIRLRQGVYTSGPVWMQADPARREALRLMAHQRINGDLIGWGLSAAASMGLPVPGPGMIRPMGWPVRPDGRTVRPDGRTVRPVAARSSGGVAALGPAGLPASLARPQLRPHRSQEAVIRLSRGPVLTLPVHTVIDCARILPVEWGLAVADAAIAQRWVKPADISPVHESLPVDGLAGPRGVRRARWALERAREGTESALESLARAVIVLGGFPEPLPQRWISTAAGRFRVDLLDEENRIIVEADGKIKYESREVIWQEKRRQDALRDAGHEVVRFTMADYFRPAPWWLSYAKSHQRSRRLGRRS